MDRLGSDLFGEVRGIPRGLVGTPMVGGVHIPIPKNRVPPPSFSVESQVLPIPPPGQACPCRGAANDHRPPVAVVPPFRRRTPPSPPSPGDLARPPVRGLWGHRCQAAVVFDVQGWGRSHCSGCQDQALDGNAKHTPRRWDGRSVLCQSFRVVGWQQVGGGCGLHNPTSFHIISFGKTKGPEKHPDSFLF